MKYPAPSMAGLETIKRVSVKDQTPRTTEELHPVRRRTPGRAPCPRSAPWPMPSASADTASAKPSRSCKPSAWSSRAWARAPSSPPIPAPASGASWVLGLATWGGAIMELLDARKMIEVESARAAALRATPQQLDRIERELRAMQNNLRCAPTYLKADMNFHRRIGEASQNAIISHFVCNIIDLLEEALSEAHSDRPASAGGRQQHTQRHLHGYRQPRLPGCQRPHAPAYPIQQRSLADRHFPHR